MMTLSLLLNAIIAVLSAQAPPCSSQAAMSAEVRWSERRSIQSPDCRWFLDFLPGRQEDAADAYIRSSKGGDSRLLFKVIGSAMIHWGKDGNSLLFEDRQFSNSYRLMLFDSLDVARSEAEALQINGKIRLNVEHNLESNEKIIYYFPRFVSWNEGQLVLSVGVMSVKNDLNSAFKPHCFGYEIETQPLKIRSTLSQSNLKKRYGVPCQMWP